MTDRETLNRFYIEEYEGDAIRSKGKRMKSRPIEQQVDRLSQAVRSARMGRIGYFALQEFHRQTKSNLRYCVGRKKDKLTSRIEKEIIPQLVRLDLSLLNAEQKHSMDEDFLDWLKKERPYAICEQPLILLYPVYKAEIIRKQMTGMVPTRPEMEFPEALEMKRRFILHVGPTNSGKTFQALERLKTAQKGIYLGPLRLLALEVYEKMQDFGVPATMLTGQEYIEDEGSRVTAATVEMADLDEHYDIAVIDEAQMVSDPDRGHSWTRALLGLRADEIHVCMAPAAREVLEHLIELTHDTCEVHEYERKTELLFEDKPFNFPEDVQQGDALIVFSKKSVLDVSGRLEESGVKSSVIYGSLPPEIRRRQMHLFTEGKTKVVVSTDAIGMGLNLPVRRIIFLQSSKYDGTRQRLLTTPEVRQIAGRAGRFGLYDTGYITAGDEDALTYLRKTYYQHEKDVDQVTLGFPQVLLTIDEPLDEILKVWHAEEPIEPFVKESVDEMLFLYDKAKRVADRIPDFDDKKLLYRMISCPVDIKDRRVVSLWLDYCLTYAADVTLRKPKLDSREKNGLLKYETYYKQLDLYYQMSSRLGKEIDDRWVAVERARTEDKIMSLLLKEKAYYIKRCRCCGGILPIDTPFSYCEHCWESYGFR